METKIKPIDLVEAACSSDDQLNEYAKRIKSSINTLGESFSKGIVEGVKKVIKDKAYPPDRKLRALKLVSCGLVTKNPIFLKQVQKDLCKVFRDLAMHRKNESGENRGMDIFGTLSLTSEENKKNSAMFLKVLLYYIEQWANEFRLDPKGNATELNNLFRKLKKENVQFPQLERKTYTGEIIKRAQSTCLLYTSPSPRDS